MLTCTECKTQIDELAVFPGGKCVDCHAKTFDMGTAMKCQQCGKFLGPEFILGPVCGACCRKNHRRACGVLR